MSDEYLPPQPEHTFYKVIWRTILQSGEQIEKFTTWTITGVAGTVALIISNLESVATIVSLSGIRAAILLFALSLLFGAISKQLGMALSNGLDTIRETEHLLNSESGQKLMGQMTIEPSDLANQLAEPFFWPLSAMMKNAGKNGLADHVSADKKFIKLFCYQIFFNMVHGALAIAAFIVIACTIP